MKFPECDESEKIDKAFSQLELRLKAKHYPPSEIFFVGMHNLVEFAFYEARNPFIVVCLSLSAILKQFEKRVPVEEDLDYEDETIH